MSLLGTHTIKVFKETAGNHTLDEFSEMTGIERTRLFRLFHGADMKLKEFETLQVWLMRERNVAINWKDLLKDREESLLSDETPKEIRIQWERQLELRSYIDLVKTEAEHKTAA